MVQLGSCPVKYRHEIIAYTLDTGFSHTADVLTVVLNIFIPGWLTQLDILMNRNTLDHIESKARILNLLF